MKCPCCGEEYDDDMEEDETDEHSENPNKKPTLKMSTRVDKTRERPCHASHRPVTTY